jgi:hypothetical protein
VILTISLDKYKEDRPKKYVFKPGDDYQESYMYRTCSRCKSVMLMCSCYRKHPLYYSNRTHSCIQAKPNLDDYDNRISVIVWRTFLMWGKNDPS